MTDTPTSSLPPRTYKIIPSREAPFREMWQELAELTRLYVPYMTAEDGGFGAGASVTDGYLTIEGPEIEKTLDKITWVSSDKERYGIVFTDPHLIESDVISIRVPVISALERYFHNPRKVAGLMFNPNLDLFPRKAGTENNKKQDCFNWTAKRFFLPRLLGMLQSKDPWSDYGTSHVALGEENIRRNQIYSAFHHAALAREQGAGLNDYFYIEILALACLGLYEQVQQYYSWYLQQGEKDVRAQILQAYLYTLSGKPEDAIAILQPLTSNPLYEAWVHLELARAHLRAKQPTKALELFDLCLSLDPHNADVLLGRGIALRNLHLEEKNKEGLAEARKTFLAVVDLHGYHEPEALHHIGTLHLQLEEWSEAKVFFKRTLEKRFSGVSLRNLILVLHAQGQLAVAAEEYRTLLELSPADAAGLEAYFPTPAAAASLSSKPSSQQQKQPLRLASQVEVERLNKQALEATKQLHQWKVPVLGDIMDFRRIDEYFCYHAPFGHFLETCVFHNLGEKDLSSLLLAIAQHLSGVLVRRNHARWVMPADEDPLNVSVRMNNKEAFQEPLCFAQIVAHRIAVGAEADNLTNLDFLVSLQPEYDKLSRNYATPLPQQDSSEREIEQYRKCADSAKQLLKKLGVTLNDTLSDLVVLDTAIDAIFLPGGIPKGESQIQAMIGKDPQEFSLGLGFHFGFLCVRYTQGTWVSHPSLLAVSLRDTLLNPLYPVQRVLNRIGLAAQADILHTLSSFESPLVCAHLARKLQNHEIETRENVASLLAQFLPSVPKDDPSGASLERMVTMIYNLVEA